MTIVWCVSTRKIFVKAWKPGINALIPIYDFYEMADIAWLSWLSNKWIWCGILWFLMMFIWLFLYPIAYFPQIWFILVCIFVIFMCIVNYNIAKNFWWSTIASILYVVFNPVAILILAFWNDKYYLTGQKERLKEISRKAQMDEFVGNKYEDDNDIITWWENLWWNNTWDVDNPDSEDLIKYIDPNQFVW